MFVSILKLKLLVNTEIIVLFFLGPTKKGTMN